MSGTLHILRSEPDEKTARLIAAVSPNEGVTVVCLYPDTISNFAVDWDRLVDDILAHDRIICWW